MLFYIYIWYIVAFQYVHYGSVGFYDSNPGSPTLQGMGPQFKIMVRIQNAGDSLSDIPLGDVTFSKRRQETCNPYPNSGDSECESILTISYSLYP